MNNFDIYNYSKTHKITKITYDYHPPMCTNHEGIAESYELAIVGCDNIVEIIEHQARGEGDKWFFDIHYKDGTVKRIFNIHSVEFKPINNESTK